MNWVFAYKNSRGKTSMSRVYRFQTWISFRDALKSAPLFVQMNILQGYVVPKNWH